MGVIKGDDVRKQPLGEKGRRWHLAPFAFGQRALLDRPQQRVLLGRIERGEADIVPTPGLGIDRLQPALPGLTQRRQAEIAVAVAAVLEQLRVDQCRQRNRRPCPGLGHDAVADRLQNQPFCLREVTRFARHGEALVDDLARLLVP